MSSTCSLYYTWITPHCVLPNQAQKKKKKQHIQTFHTYSPALPRRDKNHVPNTFQMASNSQTHTFPEYTILARQKLDNLQRRPQSIHRTDSWFFFFGATLPLQREHQIKFYANRIGQRVVYYPCCRLRLCMGCVHDLRLLNTIT